MLGLSAIVEEIPGLCLPEVGAVLCASHRVRLRLVHYGVGHTESDTVRVTGAGSPTGSAF